MIEGQPTGGRRVRLVCTHRTTRVNHRTGEARCLICEATWIVRRAGQKGLDAFLADAFLAECPVCHEPPPCPHVPRKRGDHDEVTTTLPLMPDPDARGRVQGRDAQDVGRGGR